jgi:hypothetical protein
MVDQIKKKQLDLFFPLWIAGDMLYFLYTVLKNNSERKKGHDKAFWTEDK